MGVGVPFYPTSVPSGMAVLDVDEANELREAGAYARGRIQSQKVRLDELEASKLRLEGELQRALSTGSMTAVARSIPRGATEIEPPAPAGMPQPEPAPVVPVAHIPDRAPAVAAPVAATRERKRRETREPVPIEAAAPTPAPIEPAAPAPRPVEPAAAAARMTERPAAAPASAARPAEPAAAAPKPAAAAPKPAAAAPKPAAAASKPAAEPKPAPVSKPAAKAPPPPRPARDEVPPVPTPSPRVAAAAPVHEDEAFVVVPESERILPPSRPRAVVPIPDADDADRHDAEVLDVLERLVEPIGTPVPEADPGAMRARLARTAARKKPGSRSDERFHDPDEPPAG
jgi:hypothetical protein